MKNLDINKPSRRYLINKAVTLSEAILCDSIDFFDAIRSLTSIGKNLDPEFQSEFYDFYSIEGQMDEFPVHSARSYYAKAYLERLDAEMASFKEEFYPIAVNACRQLLVHLDKKGIQDHDKS